MCDLLKAAGLASIAVGKIGDIFAHRGLRSSCRRSQTTTDGKDRKAVGRGIFSGLCFVIFVEFDSLYGHRNDAPGYARALNRFDQWLGANIGKLNCSDLLIITADHGCDPLTPSTDHSREYVPLLVYGGKSAKLGTRPGFCDVCATILDNFASRTRAKKRRIPEARFFWT